MIDVHGRVACRRDSFITHRAFCDALAEESARAVTAAAAVVAGQHHPGMLFSQAGGGGGSAGLHLPPGVLDPSQTLGGWHGMSLQELCLKREQQQQQFADADAAVPGFVLAGVLLDCSVAAADQQRFAASSTDASVSVSEQQEEEDKGYWSSILNMVNSSMSSSSSSLTSDAVTDPAMYLPSAAAAAEF